jgi:hypothetical protein
VNVLQWILLAALPAAGFLILALVLGRWGKRHDAMGGRPGHIWTSDEPSSRWAKPVRGRSERAPDSGTEPTAKTPD